MADPKVNLDEWLRDHPNSTLAPWLRETAEWLRKNDVDIDSKLSMKVVVGGVVDMIARNLDQKDWNVAIRRISKKLEVKKENHEIEPLDNEELLRLYDRWAEKYSDMTIAEFARAVARINKSEGINGIGARSQRENTLDPFIRDLLRKRRRKK